MKQIKRKPRCLKLIHRNEIHMLGLLDKSVWVNYPIAPPANN